ncbi:uncharacterized protein LOC117582964 [Drosophila guanche]|uniref:Kinesin motor domain-containing protein n=1 Tax=Drosophila guanche TaxID=7266 RepID=A0A3B0K808_DROGU|nr:uncharacterized protein LOC117582964 [Drosophila guanche]SPP81141.1 Hypothetical predicted protein [Drosophila guanche]
MNSKATSKRMHHVMVALTESNRRYHTESLEGSSLDGEFKILDRKSVLLRMPSAAAGTSKTKQADVPRYYRHLEFDAIGYDHEPHVRDQLSDLVENMFRQRLNGCLLRLTPHRSSNINLLTRVLVSEVDSIMLLLRFRLKSINVDYFDLRKFDMANMLLEPGASMQSLNRRHRVHQSGRILQSTRELLQWLLNDFTTIRGRAVGDDYIDIQFVFRDGQHAIRKLHLTIFQVIGGEERQEMADFFRSLPLGKQSNSTLLTDCIRESFDFQRPIRTVVMFELPLGRESPAQMMRKILKLADVAYVSIEKAHSAAKSSIKSASRSSTNLLLNITPSCSFRNTFQSVPNISDPLLRRGRKLSSEDYNSLAYWYNRIDSKLLELQLSMDDHYMALYRRKGLEICNELRSMEQHADIETNESGGDDRPLARTINQEEEQASMSMYTELLKQFRKLEIDVKRTAFAATLKGYISNKNYELAEMQKAFKLKAIANMRQHLIEFMKSEQEQEPNLN